MEEHRNSFVFFLKIIIAFSILAGVSYIVYLYNQKDALNQNIPFESQTAEYCYEQQFVSEYKLMDINYRDYYTLVMNTVGNDVTGELSYMPSQKDTKTGNIQGTITKDDTSNRSIFTGTWTAYAEGDTYKENIVIVFGPSDAKVFENQDTLDKSISDFDFVTPNIILPKIDCDYVYERQKATDTFMASFDTLVSNVPELGGSFYPLLIYVDTLNDTLYCVYEDGHVQYSESFVYQYINGNIFFEKENAK